ncbi:MAG: BON domain-containing protein [Desulfobacterales bacterium]|nr:MAG: BON domain-containing protein [Desulfobacterales bacterium]
MKRYFGLLMVSVMLLATGCTAALIGGAAGGGYAVATDERQTDRMVDDSTITTRINNAMIKDDVVKAHQIDVDTVGGHVTLTGVVKTSEEAQRAVQIARREAGVKSVRNNLQIGEKSWGEAFNDKWLGSKIKSKLIAEPEIRSLNIDVDVDKGIVTLTGIVGNRYQKKRAIEIAKATEGTVRVVDNLKVK